MVGAYNKRAAITAQRHKFSKFPSPTKFSTIQFLSSS